jgi:hypothetical protein
VGEGGVCRGSPWSAACVDADRARIALYRRRRERERVVHVRDWVIGQPRQNADVDAVYLPPAANRRGERQAGPVRLVENGRARGPRRPTAVSASSGGYPARPSWPDGACGRVGGASQAASGRRVNRAPTGKERRDAPPACGRLQPQPPVKTELQGLSDHTGLEITVCHFPPGTSVEQNRASPVQLHLPQLGRPAADLLRGHRQPDLRDHPQAPGSRSTPVSTRTTAQGRGHRRRTGRSEPHARPVPRRVELLDQPIRQLIDGS